MKNIIKRHFAESSQLIRTMSNHEKEIIKIVNLISKCNTNNKKILIAGNGGSSADAEHFTGELTTHQIPIGVFLQNFLIPSEL